MKLVSSQTEDQIVEKAKAAIDKLDQYQMARLKRFATAGHLFFSNTRINDYFEKRFEALGGMTPEISKQIGWGDQ